MARLEWPRAQTERDGSLIKARVGTDFQEIVLAVFDFLTKVDKSSE